MLLAAWALQAGVPPWGVATGAVYAASLFVLALQRMIPLVPEWRVWRREFGVDILHGTLSTTLGSALSEALAGGAVVLFASKLAFDGGPWPVSWPWPAQLVLALLICDLLAYGLHRLAHNWRPLWRFHELHHSSEQLYAFSSARTHPLYVALTHGLQTLPLLALGASPMVIALTGAFTGVNGMLQHCNADLRLGFLNRIFATCDLHRWHHSEVRVESDTNYGNNLSIWDQVFGTWWLPEGRRVPAKVGLGSAYPRGWVRQVIQPFKRIRPEPAQ
jgi:sterol desaturase/sphingolipid hydroxylase (fatty acid hydroxylase superfamily)